MITRDFQSIDASTDQDTLITRCNNMLNNVTKMIQEQPIYSTWIRFQVGKTEPLTFNTASTDELQNLIADFSMEKEGSGITNSFTIRIIYDPFRYGQNPGDKIELLDDLVATAMSLDIIDTSETDSNSSLNQLRGYIQYGYNNTSDSKLVSPKYQFMLTGASTSVNYENGITIYTFTGTSDLAIDCDFNISFPQFQNVSLLDVITTVLYCYYGDSSNPPDSSHILSNIKYVENEYKYKIEISDALYADSPTIENIEASASMSPWTYCKNLLDQYISKSDQQKEEYKDLSTLKDCERPRYSMYMTDVADSKKIHLSYLSPKEISSDVQLDYDFTWSRSDKNIVQKWEPQVQLQLYLVRKAEAIRKARLSENNPDSSTSIYENLKNGNSMWDYIANLFTSKDKTIDINAIQHFIKDSETNAQIEDEMYDAELTLVGIPADFPIGVTMRIKPIIGQAISRTAGIYKINSCTDNIDSSGVFTSTLKLLRIKGLNE